jgi:hypothetical protein
MERFYFLWCPSFFRSIEQSSFGRPLPAPDARAVSVTSGEGLAELASELQDSVTVLMGPSGVGKSSLVNALRRLRVAADAQWLGAQAAGDIFTQEVSSRSPSGPLC